MHLPGGLPTASWEEASGAHQAGLGLETESSQPGLIIPPIHLPHATVECPGPDGIEMYQGN